MPSDVRKNSGENDGYNPPKIEPKEITVTLLASLISMTWSPFDHSSLTHTCKNVGGDKYKEEDYGK